MSNEKYVQALLENVKDKSQLVSFIPYKIKVGKLVEDDDKERWIVKEIYLNSVTTEEEAKIRSADYRKHRKATDI